MDSNFPWTLRRVQKGASRDAYSVVLDRDGETTSIRIDYTLLRVSGPVSKVITRVGALPAGFPPMSEFEGNLNYVLITFIDATQKCDPAPVAIENNAGTGGVDILYDSPDADAHSVSFGARDLALVFEACEGADEHALFRAAGWVAAMQGAKFPEGSQILTLD